MITPLVCRKFIESFGVYYPLKKSNFSFRNLDANATMIARRSNPALWDIQSFPALETRFANDSNEVRTDSATLCLTEDFGSIVKRWQAVARRSFPEIVSQRRTSLTKLLKMVFLKKNSPGFWAICLEWKSFKREREILNFQILPPKKSFVE